MAIPWGLITVPVVNWDTLPETNSKFTPENQWLEDEFPFGMAHLQVLSLLVSGSVCILWITPLPVGYSHGLSWFWWSQFGPSHCNRKLPRSNGEFITKKYLEKHLQKLPIVKSHLSREKKTLVIRVILLGMKNYIYLGMKIYEFIINHLDTNQDVIRNVIRVFFRTGQVKQGSQMLTAW